jgi:hypothetical protein
VVGQLTQAVIGLGEGVGEQRAYVSAVQAIQRVAAVAVSGDESGEAEFGQVLRHGGAGDGDGRGQGGDVAVGVE